MVAELGASRRLGAKNLVGFEVGTVRYAAEIMRVREIIRPLPTVELPHMPPAVQGVSDHRGDVVPVVDLRRRFGLGPRSQWLAGRWIVVARDNRLVALVVDRVTEVFGGEAAEERDIPEVPAGKGQRAISSVYRYQGDLVFVVDVDLLTDVSEEVDLSLAKVMLEESAHVTG